MERVEPKTGDRIFHSGRITTIDGFSDDHGTRLYDGQWVCISDFEKNADGVWTKIPEPHTYGIGESYRATDLRKGVAVIRPAVFMGGKVDQIVTTSPCCTLWSRRLRFDELTSDQAMQGEGWPDVCTKCGWRYRISAVYVGDGPRLGLYGTRWESLGF